MLKRKYDGASSSSYSKKQRYYKKQKPTYSRFKKYSRPILPGSNSTVHFHKRVTSETSIQVTSSDVSSGLDYKQQNLVFKLSDVPGNTELTAVYDQYRIKYVKVQFTPRTVQVNTNTGVAGIIQNLKLLHAIDYDSNSSLTPADLRQYATCKEINYGDHRNKNLTVFFTPTSLMRGYESTSSDFFSPRPWTWMDCNDNGTLHYGLMIILTQYGNSLTFASTQVGSGYDISVTYYLEFRNTR